MGYFGCSTGVDRFEFEGERVRYELGEEGAPFFPQGTDVPTWDDDHDDKTESETMTVTNSVTLARGCEMS